MGIHDGRRALRAARTHARGAQGKVGVARKGCARGSTARYQTPVEIARGNKTDASNAVGAVWTGRLRLVASATSIKSLSFSISAIWLRRSAEVCKRHRWFTKHESEAPAIRRQYAAVPAFRSDRSLRRLGGNEQHGCGGRRPLVSLQCSNHQSISAHVMSATRRCFKSKEQAGDICAQFQQLHILSQQIISNGMKSIYVAGTL